MKKSFYCLIGLIGLSACSSENIVLDALRIYDVTNSSCKLSLSPTETRPDFYLENDAKPATLNIKLGKDGVALCTLEDVKAYCAVTNVHVSITNQDNLITLVVYHNVLDALADCICKYDVNFKMSRLAQGSYHLKVYYANPYMKYDESSMAYNGLVNLAQNSKASVTLNPEMLLPER
jgi:hypothetical protein